MGEPTLYPSPRIHEQTPPELKTTLDIQDDLRDATSFLPPSQPVFPRQPSQGGRRRVGRPAICIFFPSIYV